MSSHRIVRAVAEDWPSARVAGLHESDFQLIERAHWPAACLPEIGDFLDSHETSHPFQWPQWSDESAYLALLRSGDDRAGKLQWFAQCGMMYPAGRLLWPIRALTITRGPICGNLEVMEAGLHRLIDEAAAMGVAYIDIAPDWTGTFAESAASMLVRNGWQPFPGGRITLRLSLLPAADELLASFRKTTRHEIRRSINQGLVVSMAGEEKDYREFLQLYQEMARQKVFPVEDTARLLRAFDWIASEPARGGLFIARDPGARGQDSLRGGALVLRSGRRCWYIVGATAKDGKVQAGHLLQWHAMQWAKEMGCTEYDFGGYQEGATSGPALFKSGFCDHVVRFIAPHRYVVTRSRHRTSQVISIVRQNLRLRS
jgi:hypothetical protein